MGFYLNSDSKSKWFNFFILLYRQRNDTIQCLYGRIVFIDDPDVVEIGVDDVAIRKEQTYATALYDLKNHQLNEMCYSQKRSGYITNCLIQLDELFNRVEFLQLYVECTLEVRRLLNPILAIQKANCNWKKRGKRWWNL